MPQQSGKSEATDKEAEQTVQIMGHSFTLRTPSSTHLLRATDWLNARLQQMAQKHPLMKPQELFLLAAIELSFERMDFLENGKDLLKQTDALIEWIDSRLT